MRRFSLIALSAMALTMASCSGNINPEPTVCLNDPFIIPLSKSEQAINQNSNEFGIKLFRSLYTTDQVLVSPLSASLALSMTAYGARGDTETQMLFTLGFQNHSRQEVGEFFKKMAEALTEADAKTTFSTANSIWAQKSLPIKNDFKQSVALYYGADVKPADFGSNSIIQEINNWCSEKTKGLINNAADTMDPGTIMSLVNALYFKGSWTIAFDNPYDGSFQALEGVMTNVKMMNLNQELPFASDGNVMMVSIPYGNGSFVMDLILPVKEGAEAFANMVQSLNWTVYSNLITNQSKKDVILSMPVFKIEYGEELKEELCALGMAVAFGPDANFSGISDAGLCISQVIHKTLIDVNEKGTEAAAVTIVDVRESSAGPSGKVFFTADRPFVFAIRECSSNALLFLGQKVK